jgi:hypothetical protein
VLPAGLSIKGGSTERVPCIRCFAGRVLHLKDRSGQGRSSTWRRRLPSHFSGVMVRSPGRARPGDLRRACYGAAGKAWMPARTGSPSRDAAGCLCAGMTWGDRVAHCYGKSAGCNIDFGSHIVSKGSLLPDDASGQRRLSSHSEAKECPSRAMSRRSAAPP